VKKRAVFESFKKWIQTCHTVAGYYILIVHLTLITATGAIDLRQNIPDMEILAVSLEEYYILTFPIRKKMNG
jgi:hypothetical protein